MGQGQPKVANREVIALHFKSATDCGWWGYRKRKFGSKYTLFETPQLLLKIDAEHLKTALSLDPQPYILHEYELVRR